MDDCKSNLQFDLDRDGFQSRIAVKILREEFAATEISDIVTSQLHTLILFYIDVLHL